MSVVSDDRHLSAPLQPFFSEVNHNQETGRFLAVLCVFENPAFLDRICRHLEEHGDITADISISAEDALHLMMYVPFDAIVTEYAIGQSETNGFLKSVRRCGNSVPFIYFTHARDTLNDVEAREYGEVYAVEWEEDSPIRGFDALYHSVKQAVTRNRNPWKSQNGVFL